MSLDIENCRFYCTTSEVSFGPEFATDDEGEEFRSWMYRNRGDARQFSYEQLAGFLGKFRGLQISSKVSGQ